ncbi:MAG: TIR domain-containing protein [Bacillota bacterium]|nr:TIR domain-containing protein [Bacillota bacterium]
MTNSFQIYVLWHSEYSYGNELANEIFFQFNRNPEKTYQRGIGMPVYFRNSINENINLANSEKTAIVILADENMTASYEWQEYVENLYDCCDNNSKIYFVAINKSSFNFSEQISKYNHLRLYEYEKKFKIDDWGIPKEEAIKKVLICELAHEFSRVLYDENGTHNPLKVFLSHTKRDSNQIGENIAKELNAYIQLLTRASTFIDNNDIAISYDFWSEIEKNIEKSFLLIIHSDKYTSSQWCRKEVISAKKFNRPSLVLNIYNEGEIRSFPYIANLETIHIDNTEQHSSQVLSDFNCFNIVCSIFKEAVRFKFQEGELKNKLSSFQHKDRFLVLTRPPELMDLVIKEVNGKDYILYPEPPLSDEELELLSTNLKNVSFLTPTELYQKNQSIKDKKICISISETSRQDSKLKLYALKDVMVELIRYILALNGRLVYSGNLIYENDDYNLFKSMISILEEYQSEYLNNAEAIDDKKIINYLAYPLWESIDKSERSKYKKFIGLVEVKHFDIEDIKSLFEGSNLENKYAWSKYLSKMREQMIKNIDFHIVMGGKCTDFKGKYPGILEEFLLSIKNNKPIFLLGGFGGCSREIINLLNGQDSSILSNNNFKEFIDYYNNREVNKINYDDVKEFIKSRNIEELNNGLSDEENKTLFHSQNALEILQLVLKGIHKLSDNAS